MYENKFTFILIHVFKENWWILKKNKLISPSSSRILTIIQSPPSIFFLKKISKSHPKPHLKGGGNGWLDRNYTTLMKSEENSFLRPE